MILKSLSKALRKIPRAINESVGVNNYQVISKIISSGATIIIVASGNSAYPAQYCCWLLRKCGFAPIFLSPLEYCLSAPARKHAVIFFSQGAGRGDSLAVESLCQNSDVPLFLICDKLALDKDTVAARQLKMSGKGYVLTTSTCNEKSFLNIIGTSSAFIIVYELCATLNCSIPALTSEFDFGQLKGIAEELPEPSCENAMLLYGPASRAAAEAFAGYHNESLGPVMIYDMKNFTHGVWRGLKEKGKFTIYFIVEKEVFPLADFLIEILQDDHDCIRIQSPESHWSFEPFQLFMILTYLWAKCCQVHADKRKQWSPMYIDMDNYENYRGINSGFNMINTLLK